MKPRRLPFAIAATALTLAATGAEAFTLQILHFNDFHSRIEFDQRLRLDLFRGGRGRRRMFRRGGATIH